MRMLSLVLFMGAIISVGHAQTEWPVYGHDPGGMRYSPLKQISTSNVSTLKLVWTLDTQAPITTVPATSGAAGGGEGGAPAAPVRPPRPRTSQATPLVVGDVMYLGTAYNRVLALDAQTGTKIWEYETEHTPATRGLAYWRGNSKVPPQVMVATRDGWLMCLNAKTGRPSVGFGNEGMINLRSGVADKFPNRYYGVSSPPAIYKDLIFTGGQLQESPRVGPPGDIRAWDLNTGKLVWTFHTIPRPGEPNHEAWQGDEWVDRSGANVWGFMTVDVERGLLFIPLGAPTTDFWGGDRKGSNLYGSSLVALDANTGKAFFTILLSAGGCGITRLGRKRPLHSDLLPHADSAAGFAQTMGQGFLGRRSAEREGGSPASSDLTPVATWRMAASDGP